MDSGPRYLLDSAELHAGVAVRALNITHGIALSIYLLPTLMWKGSTPVRGCGTYAVRVIRKPEREITDQSHDKVFYVFSTNAEPFESEPGYSPLSVYALLEHDGDFDAAHADLATRGHILSSGNKEPWPDPSALPSPLPSVPHLDPEICPEPLPAC